MDAASPVAGDPFRSQKQEYASAAPPLLPGWTPWQTVATTLVVSAVVLGVVILYLCRDVLFFLFIGTVVATALRPPIAWLERHGLTTDVYYTRVPLGSDRCDRGARMRGGGPVAVELEDGDPSASRVLLQ